MAGTRDEPILELRGVSKTFGVQPVLRNLSLSVRRGETVVIIGESGCGKSVTLKLLVGLLKPTSGEILYEGTPLSQRSEAELTQARLKFGFLFQGGALFDSLNVRENVAFGLRQHLRLRETEIDEIVHARLHEVGLHPSICAKKPSELSGGMKKRVALARALALQPEVMLYDEPTTGLDPVMTDVINTLILQTRAARPVTSLVVTHDMATVRKVASRIVMLAPVSRLGPAEPQILFEGDALQAFSTHDPRVAPFVHGDGRERMREMAPASLR